MVQFARGEQVWWHEDGRSRVREAIVENDDGGSVLELVGYDIGPVVDLRTVTVYRFHVHRDHFSQTCSYCLARRSLRVRVRS
jgi:hypothetical protein